MAHEGKRTLTEKQVRPHLADPEDALEPGKEVGLRVDQTLSHDASGTMAFQEFEALGLPRVQTQRSVNYVDHNTLQIGPENADDHRYLQTAAAKFGVTFSKAGNGICHQVHLERFSMPGKTLLGADSHTPTCGAMGMLAIGAGGLDVAAAMAGVPYGLMFPEIVLIRLSGRLRPWVSAKDVALTLLKIFGTHGNVGRVFEFSGEGLSGLSVPERATIANMGTECGVTTSIFPSDSITKAFLESQGREQDWRPLWADEGAEYAETLDLSLDGIVPLIACPDSPGNVKEVKEVQGLKVDQVCVGSCTNSSYQDLMTVAGILDGGSVHRDVSLVVAPGSRQTLQMISRSLGLSTLYGCGARVQESACGFCLGAGQSPPTNGVSLRTSNRNFSGRSGTRTAEVYLASPETAAVSALRGEITDPRTWEAPYPRNRAQPANVVIDDRLLIPPAGSPEGVRVDKGPHMAPVPVNPPLPEEIKGEVTLKVGDQVTTDDIVPSGSRMKYRSNIPEYAKFSFEHIDSTFHERAKKIQNKTLSNIIVAGISYGQGSSREHASLCLSYLNVKAILAKTIERIHRSNLINFGIIPCELNNQLDYNAIKQGDVLVIKDVRRSICEDGSLSVFNESQGNVVPVTVSLTAREKDILLAGGAIPYLRGKLGTR